VKLDSSLHYAAWSKKGDFSLGDSEVSQKAIFLTDWGALRTLGVSQTIFFYLPSRLPSFTSFRKTKLSLFLTAFFSERSNSPLYVQQGVFPKSQTVNLRIKLKSINFQMFN
jgi:hypothetical protein